MSNVEWSTPGLIKRLKKLYFQKPTLSTRQIAATLAREYGYCFTRNSIIGKCHRLKLPVRPDAPRNDNALALAPEARPMRPKPIRVDAPILPRPQPTQLRASQSLVPFLQLQPGECKYPLGEPPNVRFCAATRFEDYPYCEEHCRVSYGSAYKGWQP